MNSIEIVRAGWGIDAETATLLGGELDASVRIDSTDGRSFCLKRRAGGAGPSVDLEAAVLSHLSKTAPGLSPTLQLTASQSATFSKGESTYWLLEWISGPLWSDLARPTPELQHKLGATARSLQRALTGFTHVGADRSHHWDLRRLDRSITQHLDQCRVEDERAIVDQILTLLADRVSPVIDRLPSSIVHQDLNDFNLVITGEPGDTRIGVIDFGDVLRSASITELAVAIAYAMLRSRYPVDAAAMVAAGWYDGETATDDELSVLMPLAIGRLVLNALTWRSRSLDRPEYAQARSSHTWDTLHALGTLPMAFIDARMRSACGLGSSLLSAPTAEARSVPAGTVAVDLDPRRQVFDGIDVQDGPGFAAAGVPDVPYALVHGEVRSDRAGFADGFGGPATIQLGTELHLAPKTEVRLPAAGTIHEANVDRLVVAHEGVWSVWTGLKVDLESGDQLEAGDFLGSSTSEIGHVHIVGFEPREGQIIASFVRPVDFPAWESVTADPSEFLGLASTTSVRVDDHEVTALRNQRLASSQRYYYDDPMTLVRASGVVLMDSNAHLYLDAINNVTHVGHGNPHVVKMASQQMQRLNTNSRFVYEEMGRFADRLVERLPDPLSVVFLVCTGSEANDLAVRIARQVTGRTKIMVIDGAYHGNTSVVTGISPNRYNGAGGDGPPATTHAVLQPNQYRGPFGYSAGDAGEQYAHDVQRVADGLVEQGEPPAAFIAESLMGTAGQVVFPDGYLASAFAHVRSTGALCISDEVQVGFGRLGDFFWGFERSGVVPDIVTMGKPLGNGHPIAAVVTTREIADEFDQGMKYFNTFGGNPVSCATGNAVLDEIDRLDLQGHGHEVGEYFLERLRELMNVDERIGDVRGVGLYLGVEFVVDRETKEPATDLASQVSERLRERGVVMYPNGDLANCLKIKPPMVFDRIHVDRFVDTLAVVLHEL